MRILGYTTGRHLTKRDRRRAIWAVIFMLPWLAHFAVFYAYPLVYGFVISFTDFTLGSTQWIGAANYKEIFEDYAFWRSIKAMLFYCLIIIPLEVFLPLWVANAITPLGRKMNTTVKLLVYLPTVASTVALIIAWKFIFAPGNGLISQLLSRVGMGRFSLFDQSSTSIPLLSLMVVSCCLGANVIIYSGALNNIPAMYYEAAEIDGATRRQQLTRITIPLLNPTMVYVFITSTIATLQIYLVPQLMTGGGPNYTTSSLLLLIYNSAFLNGEFGYASAIGIILFVITAVIAAVQFKLTKREVVEY